jgi:hypothetical protein
VASLKNMLVIGDHHPMFMVAHEDYWKPPVVVGRKQCIRFQKTFQIISR